MSNSYGSIPTSSSNAGASGEEGKSSKNTIFAALGVIAVGLFFFLGGNGSSEETVTGAPSAPGTDVVSAVPDAKHWPGVLQKIGGGAAGNMFPTTTAEASDQGWMKSDEACDSLLGEAWLFGGELAINSPVTMYFTPEVGGVAGVVSGIEVDYYGSMQENLIGTYFSEERTSSDGTYHSLAVALRSDDLCDTANPATPGNAEYIAISPSMANQIVPTHEDSPELQSDYKEGSCLQGMGYHWFQDVVGGPELTYEADTVVPVVPMYDSEDGTLNGIFFMATNAKQTGSKPNFENFWDASPGLSQANTFMDGTNPFCANLCGGCQFTGSDDGMFATMHWFFKVTYGNKESPDYEACGGAITACRNGFNVLMEYPNPNYPPKN